MVSQQVPQLGIEILFVDCLQIRVVHLYKAFVNLCNFIEDGLGLHQLFICLLVKSPQVFQLIIIEKLGLENLSIYILSDLLSFGYQLD